MWIVSIKNTVMYVNPMIPPGLESELEARRDWDVITYLCAYMYMYSMVTIDAHSRSRSSSVPFFLGKRLLHVVLTDRWGIMIMTGLTCSSSKNTYHCPRRMTELALVLVLPLPQRALLVYM